jgi:hypothetical protein
MLCIERTSKSNDARLGRVSSNLDQAASLQRVLDGQLSSYTKEQKATIAQLKGAIGELKQMKNKVESTFIGPSKTVMTRSLGRSIPINSELFIL